MKVKPNISLSTCYHCGDNCSNENICIDKKVFCCEGCKTVYEILNQSGLCDYYAYNEHPGLKQYKEVRAGKFDFLDDEKIKNKFITFSNEVEQHTHFYLPQIHCSSCLWLLENISTINPNILSSRVNFDNKEIFITYNSIGTSLKQVVTDLTRIGYEPHLSLDEYSHHSSKKIDRTRWYKIGVAGFCFSNIMMLSFPEYLLQSGVLEASLSFYFKALIVLLSIPALFYSGSEFFVSAYKSLKHRYLNIDAPVALALMITFGRSLYELSTGVGAGYLDSMSGIIFFLLLGRMLQDRTINVINFDRDYKSFFPIAVQKKTDEKLQSTVVHELKEGDTIQIHAQEIVPVDSILSKGQAEIDYSFVNGETLPVKVNKGEIIYAGGKQLSGLIELIVVKPLSQSYLTNLWNKNTTEKDMDKPSWVDNIGKYFTYLVLAIGMIAGAYWYSHGNSMRMWNALTTILIVACPCALLLAENFTYSNVLRILGLNKIYLKSKRTLENINHVDAIVFDKTGTLTHTQDNIVSYQGRILQPDERIEIASLLNQSMHTLVSPILHFLKVNELQKVEYFKEEKGQGIEAWVNEKHIKIGSATFVKAALEEHDGSAVYVKIEKEILGKYIIKNEYREGIWQMIETLHKNYPMALLSGDNDREMEKVKKNFPTDSEILFYQKPEDKCYFINSKQKTGAQVMMIGDGLNDAGALKASTVGIAITDGNNVFTPSSDVIMDASNLKNLNQFIAFAKDSRKIIVLTFIISVVYNVIGLYFAVQGTLNPLIAAILMPCSSLTIIAVTYFLSIYFGKKQGFLIHLNSPTT